MLSEMLIGFITDKTVHFITFLTILLFQFIYVISKGYAFLLRKIEQKSQTGKEERTPCH